MHQCLQTMEHHSGQCAKNHSAGKISALSERSGWVEDFPYAGVSGLLLLFVQLHTKLFPLYLLAMVPYFWRVIHSNLPRSIFLGTTLATSYVVIAYADNLLPTPSTFIIQLLSYNLIFVSYGIAALKARKVFGINPLLLLFLWLPIEYSLNHIGGVGRLFALPSADANLVTRFSYAFQILSIPFIIFLLGPLLLLLAGAVVEYLLRRVGTAQSGSQCKFVLATHRVRSRPWFYFSDLRAPPMNETVGAEQTLFVRAISTFSSRLKWASPRTPLKIREDRQMSFDQSHAWWISVDHIIHWTVGIVSTANDCATDWKVPGRCSKN
jgi:hypothetical protein